MNLTPRLKEYAGVPTLALPRPDFPTTPLAEALGQRLSCRHFAGPPLTREEMALLLLATLGVFDQVAMPGFAMPQRPTPSAGARFPLEGYLLVQALDGVPPGVHHYAAHHHRLEQLRGPLPVGRIARLFLDQPWLEGISAVLVLTAVARRTLSRYPAWGERFLWLEAGHAAQNAVLTASALGLGALNLGACRVEELAAVLGIDPTQEPPIYSLALGRPATTDRVAVRQAGGLALHSHAE